MRPNPKMDAKMADLGYVSIPTASDRTGLPRSTLYDAIRDGRLAVKTMGRRQYVFVPDLLKFGGEGAKLLWDQIQASKNGVPVEDDR